MEPVNVVREDVDKENLLYAGTDNGLYLTLDRGASWMAMNGGLPRVAIHDLVVHPRDAEIVLGTHGRSLYVASVKEVRMMDDSVLRKPLAVLSHSDVDWSSSWGRKDSEFESAAQPKAQWCYFSRESGTVRYTLRSKQGLLLCSLTDTAEAGLNYGRLTLSMDAATAAKLSKESKKKGAMLKAAEDGNYYLPEGTYQLEVKGPTDVKEAFSLEVKGADKKKRESDDALPELD
jgi:ligand-binding sensor domain-containing protein